MSKSLPPTEFCGTSVVAAGWERFGLRVTSISAPSSAVELELFVASTKPDKKKERDLSSRHVLKDGRRLYTSDTTTASSYPRSLSREDEIRSMDNSCSVRRITVHSDITALC
uniref:Uncharacterized protein n=1 Tax=Grammatophora oceanica TaxID=210454 RepID=A0A7S1YF21_9STRA